MPKDANGRTNGRPRGRPRLTIDRDAVADAVAELFHSGGYEAVSIVDTAEKLSVSRATLYRTVPTKQDLLGILFERSTREITERVETAIRDIADPAERLKEMVRLQSEAAVQMRSYMPVFFDGGDLPSDVVQRWHKWSRQFEKLWESVVAANMEAGNIEKGDLVITTRLILGMILWVSRWYRPKEKITADDIAEHAIGLLRLGYVPAAESANRKSAAPRRRRTTAR
ncbi:TetR family transcriptional regulator [Mycobacterium lentiflavum]|uniref:TetR family transcriptional regulator n=1 Tax=Mycobacterium lentiflavum TaxID=141349 RepID=A0A0E4GZG0_MYCLN|nr:TetR/AcrR family transcriptional regulator [Mycobacterium lentiflavum]CQD18121.1 TetR family transcriptional regulator [Mycobacterium lentiflavum]